MGAALQGLTVEALAREWMYFLSKRCQQIGQTTEHGTAKTQYSLPKSKFSKERWVCEGDGERADGELKRQLHYFSVTQIKGGNMLKLMAFVDSSLRCSFPNIKQNLKEINTLWDVSYIFQIFSHRYHFIWCKFIQILTLKITFCVWFQQFFSLLYFNLTYTYDKMQFACS